MTTGSTQAAIEATDETPALDGLKVLVADRFEEAGLEQLRSRCDDGRGMDFRGVCPIYGLAGHSGDYWQDA